MENAQLKADLQDMQRKLNSLLSSRNAESTTLAASTPSSSSKPPQHLSTATEERSGLGTFNPKAFPIFKGKENENIKAFREEFMATLDLYSNAPAEKLLKYCIRDKAKDFYTRNHLADETLEDALDALERHFLRADFNETVISSLETMTQTSTVLNYNNRFNVLANKVDGLSEELLLRYYKRGLKSTPLIAVVASQAKDLSTAMEMALFTDRQEAGTRFKKHRNPTSSTSSPSHSAAGSSASNPIVVNAVGSNGNASKPSGGKKSGNNSVPNASTPSPAPPIKLGKLTDADREYLKANNGCFRCRKLGHLKESCPLSKRD